MKQTNAAKARQDAARKDIGIDRVGWFALQHRDGWWVGKYGGVTCYRTMDLARFALTIIWQRDGGKRLNFRIRTLEGPTFKAGEYTPIKSAARALKDYEKQTKARKQ